MEGNSCQAGRYPLRKMTHQTFSSWAPAARNGNYNQASCRPSPHYPKFRYAAPTNHERVDAMARERDRPAGQANTSHSMSAVRRLLAEAHQTTFPESRQLGGGATVMDMILDHRLLICATDLPVDGRHRPPAPRNCAFGCRADVDAYWAQQRETGKFVSLTTSKNIGPPVSAVRSTIAWSPNLVGDDVWDSAS